MSSVSTGVSVPTMGRLKGAGAVVVSIIAVTNSS